MEVENETNDYICRISDLKVYLQRNKDCKYVRSWCAYFYKKVNCLKNYEILHIIYVSK